MGHAEQQLIVFGVRLVITVLLVAIPNQLLRRNRLYWSLAPTALCIFIALSSFGFALAIPVTAILTLLFCGVHYLQKRRLQGSPLLFNIFLLLSILFLVSLCIAFLLNLHGPFHFIITRIAGILMSIAVVSAMLESRNPPPRSSSLL